MLREAVGTILIHKRPLGFGLGSHVVDLADEFLVRLKVSLHILFRFLFKVIQLLFIDILPNPAHFLHDIESRDIGVISHHFGSSLNYY